MTSLMLRPSWAQRWRSDFSKVSGNLTVVVMVIAPGNKFIITDRTACVKR
jgi:hypothetical protein